MKRAAKVIALREPARLPGLSVGRIVSRTASSPGEAGKLEVELVSGERFAARLDDAVEEAFADDCLRTRQLVLLTDVGGEAVVLGGVQTRRMIPADGPELELRADRLTLHAKQEIVMKAGDGSTLRMNARGVVRMTGERMTLAMRRVFRVISSLAELP